MRKVVVVAGATALALIPVGAVVGKSAWDPAAVLISQATTIGPSSTRGAVSSHVLVISIDGLRADAIERHGAVVLARLAGEGAAAAHATTVVPSKTLPAHVSMVTGVEPAVHGVTWNSDTPEVRGPVGVVTVFELAKQAGFTTAVFFSKAKLRQLLKPGTDWAIGPPGRRGLDAEEVVGAATRHIRSHRPNLVFVHLLEPDRAGHRAGWTSPVYGRAVRTADAAVGELLAAADASYGRGKYTVIVTADHGGHGLGHSSGRGVDVDIPWIAWGAGVERGAAPARVKTTDTAATVLWLLGVERPASWTGRAVTPAYTAAAAYAAVHGRAAQPRRGSAGAAPRRARLPGGPAGL